MFAASRPAPPQIDVIAALRALSPRDADGAYRLGAQAMREHREADALPILRDAVERHAHDARLWQILGLSARNLSDLRTATAALQRARSLAPRDLLIAHGAARARLEAGLPAVEDFCRCRLLAPSEGTIIQGLAAARFAENDAPGAIAEIETVLRQQPLWLDGHATLARLRRMTGQEDDLRSYREALARTPAAAGLWHAWLATLTLAERFDEMPAVIAAARARIGDSDALCLSEAIAADETGDTARAAAYFDRVAPPAEPSDVVWRVRWLIRGQRMGEAAALASEGTRMSGGAILWPYAALAWRILGDPRSQWLEGNPGFVRVYDLGATAGDLELLAQRLRTLHIATDRPLDQSVRGGTQTDGPLLSRIDPEIERLRDAVRGAVDDYVAALPPVDPAHPLLAARRTAIRLAGSWSVRLTGGGNHADHVHPYGWISSAFYVGVPDAAGGGAGCLTLGACSALAPALAPFREIAPAPGRLVLFPSTMWHGTRLFPKGERLTVAVDVARLTAA
jgi:tetratricopeptide (TPR) repeat protein